jgi:hypothetical protein
MPQSLRSTINQPTFTKGIIKLALRSPEGSRRVWCVVEGVDDIAIYERMFNVDAVKVISSEDEEGKKGCRNVEQIVTDLHAEEENPRVFGIRDCDYTRYTTDYSCPANVFLTDCRDIEMMMFNAPSVQMALEAWNKAFLEKIEVCAGVVRYLGYIRIYNEIYQTSCIFHDNLTKVSLVWNFDTHSIKTDYKECLFNKYKNTCPVLVEEDDFNNFIRTKRLEEEPYFYVCRGHDVIRLLPNMMIYQEYNNKAIFQCMLNAYSQEDFFSTNLYCNINTWARERGLEVS